MTFDILGWRRVKTSKYQILSRVAKDVSCIYSCIKVCFQYWSWCFWINSSILNFKIDECLTCAQDWLKTSPFPSEREEKLEDLQEIKKSSNSVKLLCLFCFYVCFIKLSCVLIFSCFCLLWFSYSRDIRH